MKNLLLKIGVVLIIALVISTGCTQAATSYTKFGINSQRTDRTGTYVYAFQSSSQASNSLKYIWNIQPYNQQTPITTDDVFYCLAQGYGDFGDGSGNLFTSDAHAGSSTSEIKGISRSTYAEPFNLKYTNNSGILTELNALRTKYAGKNVLAFDENDDTKTINKLVWILDNMYIPGEQNKQDFLSKIPCTDYGTIQMTGTIQESIEELEAEGTNAEITDFDIEIAQQLAIWNLTNHSLFENSIGGSTGIPAIYISKDNGVLTTYSTLFPEKLGDTDQAAGRIREYYVNMVYKYFVDNAQSKTNYDIAHGNPNRVITVYANQEAQPIVTVTEEKQLEGEYNVIVKKVDKSGKTLSGAEFAVNGKTYTTGEDGTVNVTPDGVKITEGNSTSQDSYTIVETGAPAGYIKYDKTIQLTVTKKESSDNLKYEIDRAELDGVSSSSGKVKIDKTTNTITITVQDEQITGGYKLVLKKQNTKGEGLAGAVFTVGGRDYTTGSDGKVIVQDYVQITKDNVSSNDTYQITEKTAPEGYKKLSGMAELVVSKKESADHLSYEVDNVYLQNSDTSFGRVEIDRETNTITITVENEEMTGEYKLVLKKVNSSGTGLPGAVFTVDGTDFTTGTDGKVTVKENVKITKNNVNMSDIYEITEKTAPTGYKKIDGTITAIVSKKESDDHLKYELDDVTLNKTNTSAGTVEIDRATNTITVTVQNEELIGGYRLLLKKVNSNGIGLPGAVFTVDGTDYTTRTDGTVIIRDNVQINEDNVDIADIYEITEKSAPTGYNKVEGTIKVTVNKKESDDNLNYELDDVTLEKINTSVGEVNIDRATNTITITIENERIIEESIDLALRKFISKVVDSKGVTVYTADELSERIPDPDTTNLRNGTKTTAEYNHDKEPVKVSVGDKVTYTLRIYNEGNVNAYITEVTDYLSKYLDYVESEEWYREYGQQGVDRFESKARSTKLTKITGASDNLTDLIGEVIGGGILIPAYDEINDKLSYIDIQITCKVLEPEVETGIIEDYKITNIAEITGMKDKNGTQILEEGIDRDSKPNNVTQNLPETEQGWQEYRDDKIGVEDYIPGNQDDDDFEKLIIVFPKYDLALRKFIVQVGDKRILDENGKYAREPVVDTTSLKQGIAEQGYGTATYKHPKKAVSVTRGDLVTYIIRVYNEGNMDAYVSKITDYLPEYLEFIEDDELNQRFDWEYDENTREISTSITAKSSTDTYGVYRTRENGKLLSAYDGGDTLNYIDVAIRCKVSEKAKIDEIQTNIAEITEFTDTKGDSSVEDLDSKPDENLDIPSKDELPHYKEELEDNPYVPGQEDDDDYDKVKVIGTFDLALRKFITEVHSADMRTKINDRYPELSIDDNGKIKYTHKKDPVTVCTGDTVIYTIRIYNEGEIDGYANEITDDVPYGLEFIVDSELNKEYRWVMLDENHNETTDVNKAKYLVTDYLSEEQEKETGRDNLIKAFDKNDELSDKNPAYRDVQIAFKVNYKVTQVGEESRILVNVAQISEDSNTDIDSVPNRDEEYDDKNHEDDIDYEDVKVQYFDLSLLKWVTRAIVTENGETTITESGHTGYENPEPDLKVEIKSKDVKKVTVKFAYTIKITNEGEISGYAKEITDYIPAGLEFRQEDNPEWYIRADGTVATAQLEDTLLLPGESAEVQIILTWINGEENLGRKVNVAEISKDSNFSNTPDIDSTPDNKVTGEDDIDDAPVLLVIKTGINTGIKYIILTTIVIAILVTGVAGIKKFVLEY